MEVIDRRTEDALRREGARCDTSMLDGGVLCVSLKSCRQRRRDTERQLAIWGFPPPRFIDAFGPTDDEVLRWFNSPRVAKFPPCFRCGCLNCDCLNNVLILEQIANWMSFRKAWSCIKESPNEWHLLIEDDVQFTHRAGECWNQLITHQLLQDIATPPAAAMIRCGWQLGHEYGDEEQPELIEGAVRMSNHCSIMNREMARVLLQASDDFIYATSDVFAHEIIATQHLNFTMFPPISYDLSFAQRVPSLIRPKGIQTDDPIRAEQVLKAQRVEAGSIEVWLRGIAWIRRCDFRRLQERSSEKVAADIVEAAACHGWEALRHRTSSSCPPRSDLELVGSHVVIDDAAPPPWIYAAYRFFVGEASSRPRDFRNICLGWIAENLDLEPD